jgi:2-polyprenyl-6-methoxyphenol hydroxylase-like FAD-dependent oxidoreductase
VSKTGSGDEVAIVGAGTAGCSAARLFALRGSRVALIEILPTQETNESRERPPAS